MTNTRPAWYDQKLTEYRPFIRKLARRAYRRNAEDLEQEICVRAMQNWRFYKPEEYKFGTFLVQVARNVCGDNKKRDALPKRSARTVSLNDTHHQATLANQLDYAELSQTLRRLSGRDGGVLLRVAMGAELSEIANDMGISRERVRQLAARARAGLANEGLVA